MVHIYSEDQFFLKIARIRKVRIFPKSPMRFSQHHKGPGKKSFKKSTKYGDFWAVLGPRVGTLDFTFSPLDFAFSPLTHPFHNSSAGVGSLTWNCGKAGEMKDLLCHRGEVTSP